MANRDCQDLLFVCAHLLLQRLLSGRLKDKAARLALLYCGTIDVMHSDAQPNFTSVLQDANDLV